MSLRARVAELSSSGRSVQNLAKVLTQAELFKLKRQESCSSPEKKEAFRQTSPQSSGWGSGLWLIATGD